MKDIKNYLFGVCASFLILLVSSCATTESVSTTVTTGGPSVSEAVTYQGPKARIAVASFDVKAAKAGSEIGSGISDMLVSALFRSNRFVVLERGETLSDLKEELALSESGYTEAGKSAEKGTWEGADILVTGAITAFEPRASGTGGGGLVIALPWRVGGGITLQRDESYIAAELRLVDVRTSRLVNVTRVEGRSSNFKVGGLAGGMLGPVVLGGGMQRYRNTPVEKAVMVMLEDAVNQISTMVPSDYYRYEPAGTD